MVQSIDYAEGQDLPGTPYRVVRRIGAGGMGVVYEVEDTSVERLYVLKTLQSAHASSSVLADLLRKEAKTLGKLKHPNIVEVYTAGQTTDGVAYFVMEKLDGCTLGALLAGVGPLPAAFVWQIGREICDALQYVHHPRKGTPSIIHRDIKPENIFLAKMPLEPRAQAQGAAVPYLVKLLDFGISAVVDGRSDGGFNGTLLYAAPEQLLAAPLTAQADLYALGCVLFQMLTGRHPFAEARTEAELIQSHLLRVPPRVSQLVAVPKSVDDCVAAALEKRPEHRPANAHAMLRALQDLSHVPASAPAVGHTTVQDLRSAIERNAAVGYELYATAHVGATQLPSGVPGLVAAGAGTSADDAVAIDALLDHLGGPARPPARKNERQSERAADASDAARPIPQAPAVPTRPADNAFLAAPAPPASRLAPMVSPREAPAAVGYGSPLRGAATTGGPVVSSRLPHEVSPASSAPAVPSWRAPGAGAWSASRAAAVAGLAVSFVVVAGVVVRFEGPRLLRAGASVAGVTASPEAVPVVTAPAPSTGVAAAAATPPPASKAPGDAVLPPSAPSGAAIAERASPATATPPARVRSPSSSPRSTPTPSPAPATPTTPPTAAQRAGAPRPASPSLPPADDLIRVID